MSILSKLEKNSTAASSIYVKKTTSFIKFDDNTAEYKCFLPSDTSAKISVCKKVYENVASYVVDKSKENGEQSLFELLIEGFMLKFRGCYESRKVLMSTGNNIIVYCDSEDSDLSCGFNIDDLKLNSPFDWPGKNVLGYILMQVRCDLKEDWKTRNIDEDGNYIKKAKKQK